MTRKVALLAAILRLRLRVPGQYALGICAALVLVAGTSRAEDKDSDLRTLLEQQNKQIPVPGLLQAKPVNLRYRIVDPKIEDLPPLVRVP